jgi:L-lactate utilization protein LutB
MREPGEMLEELGAAWSPDFDAYAAGQPAAIRCVLCKACPCQCPPFGTPEYFALLDKVHGR